MLRHTESGILLRQLVIRLVVCLSVRDVEVWQSVMLSPRGQSGLEAKIVASALGLHLEALASALASRFWPRPGLDLVVLIII